MKSFCCALCSASLFIMAFGTICSYYFGLCDVCLFVVVVIVVAGRMREVEWASAVEMCGLIPFSVVFPYTEDTAHFREVCNLFCALAFNGDTLKVPSGSLLNDVVEWFCGQSERIFMAKAFVGASSRGVPKQHWVIFHFLNANLERQLKNIFRPTSKLQSACIPRKFSRISNFYAFLFVFLQNSSQNKALNINFVIFVLSLQILSRNRPISHRVQRAERSAADTARST